MSDLTEFLLARIAEDEASPNAWLRFEVRDGVPGNYAIPERVLAECDAKRRIVEWCGDREMVWVGGWADDPEKPKPEHFVRGPLRNKEGHIVMQLLALPYADHPDYREEWKS